MTDSADFLRAILAAPDDDATRLVYADWLEEQGDLPRAMLIRAQCDVARLPRWDRRSVEASWEAEQLLALHGTRWRAELPALEGIAWSSFDRGFASGVKADTVAALYEHAAAIALAAPVFAVDLDAIDETGVPWSRERVPWLTTLRFFGGGKGVEHVDPAHSILSAPTTLEIVEIGEYERLAWLEGRTAHLTRLSIDGAHVVGQGFAQQLAASKPAGLAHLALGTLFVDWDSGYYDDPTLGIDGAQAIADAGFDGLVTLDLRRQRVGATGLAAVLATMPLLRELGARAIELDDLALFESPAIAAGTPLVRLDLGKNAIGNAGVTAIVRSPRLATLESLELDTCEVSAAGITALTGAPCWQTLRVLDLGRNPVGFGGVLALTHAATPAHLHTLRLADADLTTEAVTLLAGVPWLRALLVVDFSANAGGTAAPMLEHLAAGTALRQLSVAKTGLDATAARALAPLWERLVHLDASGNALGVAGLDALVTDRPAALHTLNLRGCGLDGAALDVLLSRAHCPQLRALDLASNALDPASLERLLASPLVQQLESLDLTSCGLTDAAVPALARMAVSPRLRALRLRDNTFSEAGLVELARSESLHGIPTLTLSGDFWSFEEATRDYLTERLGEGWSYEHENLEEERPY